MYKLTETHEVIQFSNPTKCEIHKN